jgi:hypothetical protein
MNLLDFDTTAFFFRSWRMGLQMSEVSWLTSRDPRQLEGMRWQVFGFGKVSLRRGRLPARNTLETST